MLSFNLNSKRFFSTKVKKVKKIPTVNEPTFEHLYGYALRDKFAAICHADLIAKVLNKTENDIMLLRSTTINTNHVGQTFTVYNGLQKYNLFIKSNMVGFKVGEFVPSRKIHHLKTGTLSISKFYKRIEKPTAVLSKDQRDLVRKSFKILNTND